MNEHLQFDEDFDLYALGAFDPEEKLAFESHLKDCEDCATRLATAHARIALLALSAPVMQPPPRVREQLLTRIKESSPQQISASQISKAEDIRRSPQQLRTVAFWRRPLLAWTFATAMAAICLVFAIYNYQLKQTLRDYQLNTQAKIDAQNVVVTRARAVLSLLSAQDTQSVTLTEASIKPRMEGKAYYHPSRGLIFYATNMPAAPTGRTYQLWLVPAQGSPISAGVFTANAKGDASIVLPALPKGVTAKAFAVTIEPEGGVPQPTGPKVLIGGL